MGSYSAFRRATLYAFSPLGWWVGGYNTNPIGSEGGKGVSPCHCVNLSLTRNSINRRDIHSSYTTAEKKKKEWTSEPLHFLRRACYTMISLGSLLRVCKRRTNSPEKQEICRLGICLRPSSQQLSVHITSNFMFRSRQDLFAFAVIRGSTVAARCCDGLAGRLGRV